MKVDPRRLAAQAYIEAMGGPELLDELSRINGERRPLLAPRKPLLTPAQRALLDSAKEAK